MYKNIRRCFVLLFALGLSACATGPTFQSQAPKQNQSIVYIFRPAHHAASGGFPYVTIDGKKIGYLKTGGYLQETVTEGLHTIVIVGSFFWAVNCSSVTIKTQPGTTHYLELVPDVQVKKGAFMSPAVYECLLLELPESQALPLIKKTKLSQ